MMNTDTHLELNDGDMQLRGTLHEIYVHHQDLEGTTDNILTSVLKEGDDLLDFKFAVYEEGSSLYRGGKHACTPYLLIISRYGLYC